MHTTQKDFSQRTLPQLFNDVYEIIDGKDVSIMENLLWDLYPKSHGKLSKLNLPDLREFLPALIKEYEKHDARKC